MNTVISRCAQGEFSVIKELAEGVYRFGWGAQVEMLPVIENDAPTGEYVASGMVTYEATMFYGTPTAERLESILTEVQRIPSLSEMDAILSGLGFDDGVRARVLQSFKIRELERYDESSAVNECFITYSDQLFPYWSSKSERNDLKQAVLNYRDKGYSDYRLDLRDVGVSLSFSCDALLSMLSDLEVYAIQCFNVTTDHLYAIRSLTSVDAIISYDFTTGYPPKLTF